MFSEHQIHILLGIVIGSGLMFGLVRLLVYLDKRGRTMNPKTEKSEPLQAIRPRKRRHKKR